MRFYGLALVASAAVLGACGGGDKQAANTDTAAAKAAAQPAAAPATASTAAYAAPTGQTHDIKMVQDAKGYHFDPSTITIKQGDALNFVVVSGQPHSVNFDQATAEPAKDQIDANMQGEMSPLSSPMLATVGDHFLVSFSKVPAGTYTFHCTPHQALGMTGTVTVQ